MSYPEFREAILQIIEERVTAGVTVRLYQTEKLNGCVRYGIVFSKEDALFSPTIYLEPFYRAFERGERVEQLAEELLRCYLEETEKVQLPDSIQKMQSYETAADSIFVKLICAEANQHMLAETPHRLFLDFAIVPYFEVREEGGFKGSVSLKNQHLEFWKVSAEEVLSAALERTRKKKGVQFCSMAEVLDGFLSEEEKALFPSAKDGLFVLTNREKYLGAVTAFFPEVQEQIAMFLEEDFYLLPASVHEWVIVPKSQADNEAHLLELVRTINDSEVIPEERLSYQIYFYHIKTHKIHICNQEKSKIY